MRSECCVDLLPLSCVPMCLLLLLLILCGMCVPCAQVPLINVILPFAWKSFPFIFTADVVAMVGVYAWKVSQVKLHRNFDCFYPQAVVQQWAECPCINWLF